MPRKGDSSRLIDAAVRGATLEEMAHAAGLSVSTVQRRLKETEIALAIREANDRRVRELSGRLNEGSFGAAAKLEELVHHHDPRIALSAAVHMLRIAARLATVRDHTERLAALEEAAKGWSDSVDDEGGAGD